MPTVVKAVIGLVIIAGFGGIAFALYQGLTGGEESGGASTPEEAVEALVTAVNEDDLLGVISTLHPGETAPVLELVESVALRSEELDIGFISPEGITATDISVSALELTTEELHPDVVKVTIGAGELSADLGSPDLGLTFVDGDSGVVTLSDAAIGEEAGGSAEQSAEYGPYPLDSAFEGVSLDIEDETATYDGDTFVMIVRHNGGWYISPMYTAAQLLIETADWPDADFTLSRAESVVGADTPEAAVEALAGAAKNLDPEEIVPLLSPGEFGVAYDYLDSVLGEIDRDDFDESVADLDLDVEVAVRLGEEIDDRRQQVILDSLDVSWYDEDSDERAGFEIQGQCVDPSDGAETCLDDWLAEPEQFLDPAFAELLPPEPFVVVVNDGNGWYVSPLETIAAYVRYASERLGRSHLDTLGVGEPVALVVGEPTTVTPESLYFRDSFDVEVEEGEQYVMVLTGTEASFRGRASSVGEGSQSGSSEVYLYGEGDAHTDLAVFQATSDHYRVGVQLDPFSTFFFEEDPDLEGVSAEYTVEIRSLEVTSEVVSGEPLEGSLEAGELVAYEFESDPGSPVVVTIEGDVRIDSLSPSGYPSFIPVDEPWIPEEEGTFVVYLVADADTDYVIEIGPPQFDLEFDNPSGSDPKAAAIGEGRSAQVGADTITDYVFYGDGSAVIVTVAGVSENYDPIFNIYDRFGDIVTSSLGDSVLRVAEVELNTEIGEPYIVSIEDFVGASGEFRLEIEAIE